MTNTPLAETRKKLAKLVQGRKITEADAKREAYLNRTLEEQIADRRALREKIAKAEAETAKIAKAALLAKKARCPKGSNVTPSKSPALRAAMVELAKEAIKSRPQGTFLYDQLHHTGPSDADVYVYDKSPELALFYGASSDTVRLTTTAILDAISELDTGHVLPASLQAKTGGVKGWPLAQAKALMADPTVIID